MAEKHNNLSMFRKEIDNFLVQSKERDYDNEVLQIVSFNQLKSLVNYLCDLKLLTPSDVQKIVTKIQPVNQTETENPLTIPISTYSIHQSLQAQRKQEQTQDSSKKKKVSFPLSVPEFENIIMVEFGDQSCQNLLTDLKKFKILLKQIKGVLNVWKDKGLTNDEKTELQSIFAKGNQKILNFCNQLKIKKELLESISEQEIQMIKALDEFIFMQKIARNYSSYTDFQKINKPTISSLFSKLQVKEVHFKKSQFNTKNHLQIHQVKGYNSKNDEPVEVVLIAKNSINFDRINKQLIKFDALKQLSLSAYFPKFLGFNTHSNPTHIQYFTESLQSKNLSVLIKQQTVLDINNSLIKYWIYQIYKAFYDLFLMCSYQPELPIKLQSIQVRNYGLSMVLKSISFTQKRKLKFSTKIDPLETKLLQNLGSVLLSLLGIECTVEDIDKHISQLESKCLLKGLLNIVESHLNYEKNIVDNYLSFFNMQTHTLLQEFHFSQGTQLIETYLSLFGPE